jgi:hypothetical protein
MDRVLLIVWCLAIGPALGWIAGQRYVGVDCGLSPTTGEDVAATFRRLADTLAWVAPTLGNSLNSATQGGLRMPTDPIALLLWLALSALALAALAWWRRGRNASTQPQPVAEAPLAETAPALHPERRWGRDYKLAIGSSGVKSIVREGRTEQAYQLQRRVVTAYSDLKALANQHGLPQPAPLPIAQSAYDNRLFLLATSAYADAFAAGDASAEDRAIVRADYAGQYNLGLIWANRSEPSQRQEGLARLATACRINEQLQLGSPEACNELQTLVGPRARWPFPAPDQLINPTGSMR